MSGDERLMGPNICQQVVTFGALGNHLLQPKRSSLITTTNTRITAKVSTVWSVMAGFYTGYPTGFFARGGNDDGHRLPNIWGVQGAAPGKNVAE